MTRVSPNQPKTPLHSFRCDDELWNAVKERARDHNETIADVLRRALTNYMKKGRCSVCGREVPGDWDMCTVCEQKLKQADEEDYSLRGASRTS